MSDKTVEKRKRKKPSKSELKMRFVESVPVKDRWWSVWACEPSHTVASIVSETPQGSQTEEIWNMSRFKQNVRIWMEKNKNEKYLSLNVFSK